MFILSTVCRLLQSPYPLASSCKNASSLTDCLFIHEFSFALALPQNTQLSTVLQTFYFRVVVVFFVNLLLNYRFLCHFPIVLKSLFFSLLKTRYCGNGLSPLSSFLVALIKRMTFRLYANKPHPRRCFTFFVVWPNSKFRFINFKSSGFC